MKLAVGRCLIPELLRKRGWIQQDLADRTGVNKRTISLICRNKRKNITLLNAMVIATVLDVSPADLFEWIEQRNESVN